MELTSNLVLAFSWFNLARNLLIALFVLSCLLLIGMVLLQKGRGGGISSAFGGAMGSSPFGTKTGDVFTWITVVLAGIFLVGAMVLNIIVEDERAVTGFEETAAPDASPERSFDIQPDPSAVPPAGPSTNGAEVTVPIPSATQPEASDGPSAVPGLPVQPPAPPGDNQP